MALCFDETKLIEMNVLLFTDCLQDNYTCPSPRDWKCDDGECVRHALVCDGSFHCSDDSDEHNCAKKSCLGETIQCADQIHCVEVS